MWPIDRECVSTGAAGARTFGTSPFAPADFEASSTMLYYAVLRPRTLQDAPAPADPNS